MADLHPYEVRGIFERDDSPGGMIDLGNPAEIRARFYARTIYCLFAESVSEARMLAAQLQHAGKFSVCRPLQIQIRKHVVKKPKLDWNPSTGKTDFGEDDE